MFGKDGVTKEKCLKKQSNRRLAQDHALAFSFSS